MRMFPHDEEWKTKPMESPHPSVDAALVQAIDTVARRLFVLRGHGESFDWKDFPGISEADWDRVEKRILLLVAEVDRGQGPYEAAYELLKQRART